MHLRDVVLLAELVNRLGVDERTAHLLVPPEQRARLRMEVRRALAACGDGAAWQIEQRTDAQKASESFALT